MHPRKNNFVLEFLAATGDRGLRMLLILEVVNDLFDVYGMIKTTYSRVHRRLTIPRISLGVC